MKALLIVLPLAFAACENTPLWDGIPIAGHGYNGPAPRLEGQDTAEMVVWKWTYGDVATVVPPPAIVWRRGDVCHNRDSGVTFQDSFECNAPGNCCDGYFWRYRSMIEVEEKSWSGLMSDSAYAHELCHAWLWARGVDTDSEHQGLCFKGTDGNFQSDGSLVAEAIRRLKVVGL